MSQYQIVNPLEGHDFCSEHPLFWKSAGVKTAAFLNLRGLTTLGDHALDALIAGKMRGRVVTQSRLASVRRATNLPRPLDTPLLRAFYTVCDFDFLVDAVVLKPFDLEFTTETGSRGIFSPCALVFFPRCSARGRRKRPLLVMTATNASAESDGDGLSRKVAAAQRFAQEEGFGFRLLTETDLFTPYWLNARLIRPLAYYKAPYIGSLHPDYALLDALRSCDKNCAKLGDVLREAAAMMLEGVGDDSVLESTVSSLLPWALSWIRKGQMFADLRKLLSMESLVRGGRRNDAPFSCFDAWCESGIVTPK